jgi:predicted TIM-barrel fold metal-dependent hydrolase
VQGALLLPTANPAGVQKINRLSIQTAAQNPFIIAAGTLHPDIAHMDAELNFLRQHRVRAIKLCSFSQGFGLDGPNAIKMFNTIQSFNDTSDAPFAVVLDTLSTAHYHFGTPPGFTTTPERLAGLAKRYPGINFIAAHMGGLDAPYDEIRRHLKARPNLYLDTSNAAHTLSSKDFCELLTIHGPSHILFGTDWPWFFQKEEIGLISGLLDRAGFSQEDKNLVFCSNIYGLLGL